MGAQYGLLPTLCVFSRKHQHPNVTLKSDGAWAACLLGCPLGKGLNLDESIARKQYEVKPEGSTGLAER